MSSQAVTADPVKLRMTLRRVDRNSILNLCGHVLPLCAAVFSIPVLNGQLGLERFGLVTLAWAILAYGGIFDVGLGRALTHSTAQSLGLGEPDRNRAEMFWAFVFAAIVIGSMASFFAQLLVPTFVGSIQFGSDLTAEATRVSGTVLLSMPAVIACSGLRGYLEAHHRFDFVVIGRIFVGLALYLAPVIGAQTMGGVVGAVVWLTGGIYIAALVHVSLCYFVSKSLWPPVLPSKETISRLANFGGWMTITNVVGPLMAYMDRFLLAGFVSVSAVALYAAPYDAVTRIGIFPAAIAGVLFPAFARDSSNHSDSRNLYARSVFRIVLVTAPMVICSAVFAEEILLLWMGPEFSQSSAYVLRWLSIGVFANGLAQVPYAYIQGTGRPKITALLHLFELPIYLLSAVVLTTRYGITGMAVAWVARAIVDFIALHFIASELLSAHLGLFRFSSALVATCTLCMVLSGFVPSLAPKIVLVAVCFLGAGIMARIEFMHES